MNAVYLRIALYVISTFLGAIPAAWAGWVSYDAATSMLSLNVEAILSAVLGGGLLSAAVFRKWGVK